MMSDGLRHASQAEVAAMVPEQEPNPDWREFLRRILSDPAFNQVFGAAYVGVPLACSSLGSAFAQVATGDLTTFGFALDAICSAGGATQGQRDGWAVMAEECDLPADICAVIRGGNA